MNYSTQLINEYQNILDKSICSESVYVYNSEKSDFYYAINLLQRLHIANCYNYENFIKSAIKLKNYKSKNYSNTQRILEALPISIFKKIVLRSSRDNNFNERLVTSSGTSGSSVSRIFIDKRTSINQMKVLKKLTIEEFGKQKYKMLILASKPNVKGMLSASDSAILGFSNLADEVYYGLKFDEEYDESEIFKFINSESNYKIIFGFTFPAYKFLLHLLKLNMGNLHNVVLLHGGGWKRYQALGLNNTELISLGVEKLGFKRVTNYYGMAEQLGSIYFECSEGYFHTSIFNDVSIVNSKQEELHFGASGFLVVRSILPLSYPGHQILTDDTGIIFGCDTCKCGRPGKFFKVFGRHEPSQTRGCSDAI